MSDTPPLPSAGPGAHAPKDSPKALAMSRAARQHVVPFAVWMALLFVVQVFNLAVDPANEHALNLVTYAAAYAWRAGLGLAALLLWRPWRHYAPLQRRNLLPALGLGAVVFVLWIGVESDVAKRTAPGLARFYETWCVLPFGKLREPLESLPYAPATCGWTLTLVRLAGSAFVIAVIEEFFWRGFLYRWVQTLDFLDVDPGKLHWPAFLGVSVVFAALHVEWAAALLTGLAYGYFYIRTRDVWATALAHVSTNLLLGAYILATGHYHFW
jgi:hypothetical protein